VLIRFYRFATNITGGRNAKNPTISDNGTFPVALGTETEKAPRPAAARRRRESLGFRKCVTVDPPTKRPGEAHTIQNWHIVAVLTSKLSSSTP
jgi:hypothetical protein